MNCVSSLVRPGKFEPNVEPSFSGSELTPVTEKGTIRPTDHFSSLVCCKYACSSEMFENCKKKMIIGFSQTSPMLRF
jgi:hypothetical protein